MMNLVVGGTQIIRCMGTFKNRIQKGKEAMKKKENSLKRVIAGILAAGMMISMTACGGGSSSSAAEATTSTTESTQETASATKAEPEGSDETFYLVSSNKAEETVRMRHCWVDNGYLYQQLTFRGLFLADSTLENVQPDLAADYQVSDDGLVYTITMKDNLKWSDGEPLTAEDVRFSIKTLLHAALSNAIYTTAFNKIVGAEEWVDGTADDLAGLTVDGNTITMTLTEPYNNMIKVLAQFTIYPEHCLADADPAELHNNEFWEHPVGSGMYYLSEFNPGNYFVLEPNPYYEGEPAKIKRIQINFVSDNVTEAQANRVDYYDTNSPSDISEFNKLSAYTGNIVDILFFRYFICNLDDGQGNVNELIADPRVREAFMYAIDKNTLIESLFPDLATATNTGLPSYDPNYDSSLNQYPYDPEKAKQLLEEANFDFSKTLKIRYYYNDQPTIDFMQAIAYYLGEVGVQCDVQAFTESGTSGMFVTRDYDICYKGLAAFDISEWYGEYSSSNANFSKILGGDTSFDELYNELLTVSSEEEKATVLKKLQALEQEKLFKLPLATFNNYIYINTDRVWVPEGVTFGNPRYRYDMDFENWKMY